jgi:hypothetical protein
MGRWDAKINHGAMVVLYLRHLCHKHQNMCIYIYYIYCFCLFFFVLGERSWIMYSLDGCFISGLRFPNGRHPALISGCSGGGTDASPFTKGTNSTRKREKCVKLLTPCDKTWLRTTAIWPL